MKPIAFVVLTVIWTLTACTTLLPEAARQYKALQESLQPSEPDISNDQRLADLGYAAIADGNLSLAETHLNSALAINPHNPYALLNLGVVYQSTGRLAEARELYAKVIALNPEATALAATRETHVGLRLDEIARNNLERLDAATAAEPPPKPGPDDIERAILQRFSTLARLQNEGLITPAEYAARRQANLGALLPLTAPPPSPLVFLPAPHVQHIVLRLRAIAQFRDAGGLTPAEHALERNSILDGLMPVMPGDSVYTAVPPEVDGDPTEELTRLDLLLAARYISTEEHRRERATLLTLARATREKEAEARARTAKAEPPPSEKNFGSERLAVPATPRDAASASLRSPRAGNISPARPHAPEPTAATPPARSPHVTQAASTAAVTEHPKPSGPPAPVVTRPAGDTTAGAGFPAASAPPIVAVDVPPMVNGATVKAAKVSVSDETTVSVTPEVGAKAEKDAPGEPAGNGIGVHVSSFRTPERARKDWDALRVAHGDVLGGLGPHIARVDLGGDKGVFFQLRIGPLADRTSARALCDELKRRNLYCAPTVF